MRGSAAACLLGLRVRIPPGHGCRECCVFCVLSARGLCVGPIPRPGGPSKCGLSECDLEASIMKGPLEDCFTIGGGGEIIFVISGIFTSLF